MYEYIVAAECVRIVAVCINRPMPSFLFSHGQPNLDISPWLQPQKWLERTLEKLKDHT